MSCVVPQISISPAPPVEPVVEPYSPFASIKYADDDDGFRSRLLTPPPSSSFRSSRSCSPGFDSDEERFDYNEGLDTSRFQALLQATRERNARRGRPDLRREVTLRAHNAKQVERRARFITRVLAVPLAAAANSLAPPCVPPPSSPDALATLAKPKPLSLFHEDDGEAPECGVYDQETYNPPVSPEVRGITMPSLEELRARLISKQPPEHSISLSDVGIVDVKAPQPHLSPKISQRFAPSPEPTDQTRVTRAKDMLFALKRRTSPPTIEDEDKRKKRHSAPGDLFPSQARVGFHHSVLSMPGGF